MKPAPFTYHDPTTADEAVALLASHEDAKILAGGQSLMPMLNMRFVVPDHVIDLNRIDGIAGIRDAGDRIEIGAMTRQRDLMRDPVIAAKAPVIAEALNWVGHFQTRNRGTIGGSISNNDPAADYPSAVVGLGATVHTNKREIPGDDFFTGMFETALEEDELVTKVVFPIPEKAAYMKFPNPASRYAVVGTFVSQGPQGTRVAVTGAGPCVFRQSEMESALEGNFAPEAVENIKQDDGDLNSDIHASAEYRAHLVTVMAKRAVAEANG